MEILKQTNISSVFIEMKLPFPNQMNDSIYCFFPFSTNQFLLHRFTYHSLAPALTSSICSDQATVQAWVGSCTKYNPLQSRQEKYIWQSHDFIKLTGPPSHPTEHF